MGRGATYPLRSLITRQSDIESAPQAYTDFDAGSAGKFVITWD